MAASPPQPDPRLRCQHVKIKAEVDAWSHASTPPPSTRYRHLQAAASAAWTAGRSGPGSACANPADGSRALMTHPASTPRHTTKKPTTPSPSCSSTRTRDGATSTSAPSDGGDTVVLSAGRRPQIRDTGKPRQGDERGPGRHAELGASLLSAAAKQRIAPDYVRRLLAAVNQTGDSTPARWPGRVMGDLAARTKRALTGTSARGRTRPLGSASGFGGLLRRLRA